ncbi:hypothetical protein Fmac_002968 [Flemingia macrophylla]|uniref:Myb-like domain-containing protein n=1 Tax=Flemingia macrophylla TaxID=520843 RepID=A0ABD1NM69_9FABA
MSDRNSIRRSPRFFPIQDHITPNPKSAKRKVSAQTCAVATRRSPRLNGESSGEKLSGTRVKGGEAETHESRVVSEKGFGGGAKKGGNGKSVEGKTQEDRFVSEKGFGEGAKKRGNVERVEVRTEDNRVVMEKGFGEGRKKERKRKRVEVKTKEDRVVLDEGFGGGRKKGGNGKKRKRGVEEIGKGWTKEQELALERAYLAAKPSPHFWKNVSKLVPGKSQQDCFDRIHRDCMTPPQSQPRLRAKALKSSPLHEFSISASKLLKSNAKIVRKSNILKPKNIITQKSVEKLLQCHLKVDLDREGDIFSVLEPNIEFSINTLQPSEALSTPKQQKENKGFLQSCTETSSSSHKKPHSRFSGSHATDLVSPPVLKQVKSRVMHEKYINQLRCRESRRRADSTKIIGEGRFIQKKGVVRAAKVALVSEAREAINKFQQSQVNFMGNTCSSDEDNDAGDESE